jgi:hypothetical protein
VRACRLGCGGLSLVGSRSAAARRRAREEGEDFADGGFLGGGFGQREAGLDLVAVAAAVFVLDHVAGCGQAGDDAVGAAPGAVQAGRDVAQPRARVAGDAQQRPGVSVWKLQPVTLKTLSLFPEIYC